MKKIFLVTLLANSISAISSLVFIL
jgi:hypothetical protein